MDPLKQFAKGILPAIVKFYEDPKNREEFEAWKAEREKEKEKEKAKEIGKGVSG